MKHQGTVTLETERLILQKFKLDDAPAIFQNLTSDEEVTKYLTWQTHKKTSRYAGLCQVLPGKLSKYRLLPLGHHRKKEYGTDWRH